MTAVRTFTAALVGNPNTGKTTLFNALSGMRQQTGNYPGVTVETKKGRMNWAGTPFDLIDLPGTYSLSPRSPDEMVAVDVILGYRPEETRPDVVLSIVDASNLERNLYLTSQAMELGVPVVVALNMVDVAEGQGVRVDAEQLSQRLGVPVVPIQANSGKGLDRLRQALEKAAGRHEIPHGPSFPEVFEREVEGLRTVIGEVPSFLLRRCLIDAGGYTEQRLIGEHGAKLTTHLKQARDRLTEAGHGVPGVEARTRYGWIREIARPCVTRETARPKTWTDRLDRVLTHRFWGLLAFVLVMFGMFLSIFWLAKPLMLMVDICREALATWVGGFLSPGPLTSLLIDGVIKGVGSVLVFLPQILILFGFIAVLEDCGYMARAAYLMDRLMSRCGLSGKSFIPLLSSMACAVPGILATRVIENPRDRLVTILVAPLMSCSARLPVYLLMVGAFLPVATATRPDGYSWWVPGLVLFAMYMIGLVLAPLVAWVLKSTLLRGETPMFVMEMPLYKWPSLKTVLWRMLDAAGAFLRRAGTMILATMIVVWALLYFPSRISDPKLAQEATATALAAVEGDAELTEKIEKLREQLTSGTATYDLTIAALDEAADYRKENDRDDATKIKGLATRLTGEWKRGSWLGWMGRGIEPVVRPLGWDWRIGTAALASFPAREVIIGTLVMIFDVREDESDRTFWQQMYESLFGGSGDEGETQLSGALKAARWQNDEARPLFTLPVALSLMVFFALCAQCVSTLAVIRRETRSTGWAVFSFVYMTVLAYVAALLVFQIGSRLG